MSLALHEARLFAWSEWTAALSREINAPPESGPVEGGGAYYRQWLAALESLVVEKGVVSREALAARRGGVGARRAGDAARERRSCSPTIRGPRRKRRAPAHIGD